MNAIGRSDYYLGLEIIKSAINIALLIGAVLLFDGVIYIAWSAVIGAFISVFINIFPNKKLLKYSVSEQLRDMAPPFLLSLVMFIFVYVIGILLEGAISVFLLLLIQIICGVLLYAMLSYIFRLNAAVYLLNILGSKRKR